jgi:proteic killer suppression protein
MEITFEKDYLQEMYKTGKSTDKRHRYQPEIIRKYIRVVDIMIDVEDTNTLRKFNSLNYEKLKGDKSGLSSVRVNDQYRIEFKEKIIDNQTIATNCNITDLSNLYK